MTNVCGKFEFDRLIKLSDVKRHLLKEKFFHFRFDFVTYMVTQRFSQQIYTQKLCRIDRETCVFDIWEVNNEQRFFFV